MQARRVVEWEKEGIPLSAEHREDLRELCDEMGVEWPLRTSTASRL